jgi:CHAD domain-containing protein
MSFSSASAVCAVTSFFGHLGWYRFPLHGRAAQSADRQVKLKRKSSVPGTVKRAVRKGIGTALDAIDAKPEALLQDSAVHGARKQLKRSRGLLRVVRDDLGRRRFARTNRRLRDASRPLSQLRDVTVLIDTLDGLRNAAGAQAGPFKPVRRALQARRQQVRQRILKDRPMRRAMVKELRKASRSVAHWSAAHRGWKAVGAGLSRAYRKGRAALDAAAREKSDGALHEARKRTKDLLYATEFIVHAQPDSIQPIIDDAHGLTDALGDDHDLAVLGDVIDHELGLRLSAADRNQITRLVARRRKDLQQHARALGQNLYAQSDTEFLTRIHDAWKAWRRKGQ